MIMFRSMMECSNPSSMLYQVQILITHQLLGTRLLIKEHGDSGYEQIPHYFQNDPLSVSLN